MFQTIMAFFGYVKIPKEAVELSMKLEREWKWLAERTGNAAANARLMAQETLTEFLRSGKLLS